MNAIITFLRGIVTSAGNALSTMLKTFFMTFLGMFALTLVMWMLNIFGCKEVNYLFFFLGGIMIFFIGINPATIVTSVLIGAVSGGVNHDGIMKGALRGPAQLLHLVLGLLYAFFVLSGVLATTSFEESPSAFFAIMAMVMLLGVAVSFYGEKFGSAPMVLVTLYVVYVCIRATWAIVPVDTKYDMGMSGEQIQRIDKVIGTGSRAVREKIQLLVDRERAAREALAEAARKRVEAAARAAKAQQEAEERKAKIRLELERKAQERKELEERIQRAINDFENTH